MRKRKLESMFMAFLMMIAMIPAAAINAYADEKQEQVLSVYQDECTVAVGQTDDGLNVDVYPGDGDIIFKSEDESIATVSEYGEVTGKKVGTTNIIVYAAETEAYKKSNESKIKVTVVESIIQTPVKITGKTVKIKYKKLKKKTQKLSASRIYKLSPKGAFAASFRKVKGNKKIKINAVTGKVTVKKGLKKGTYKVKVEAEIMPSVYDDCNPVIKTFTFKIKVK